MSAHRQFRQQPISIHVLRAEDDSTWCSPTWAFWISIHVLRAEDDFTPTAPADISIHVLRAEDDCSCPCSPVCKKYFNPRPPCGGRPASNPKVLTRFKFQSTSSVRRTTYPSPNTNRFFSISIHVLRAEDDLRLFAVPQRDNGFQSTSSVRRTTCVQGLSGDHRRISIHVLRAEDDRGRARAGNGLQYFNPRPPCGGRHLVSGNLSGGQQISIHVLRAEDDTFWRCTVCFR